MILELKLLIELHDIDKAVLLKNNQVFKREEALKKIDLDMENLEKERDLSQKALDENRKNINKEELDLAEKESKQGKYKEQLANVKTNKEYQAILKEIETMKKSISSCEDNMLELLNVKDSLDKKHNASQKEFNKKHTELTKLKKHIKKEKDALSKEVKSYYSKKEKVFPGLSSQMLKEYDRLIENRKGIAVAKVEDSVCEACHMKLTPQLFQILKRNNQVLRCSNCSRFIFYSQETPA